MLRVIRRLAIASLAVAVLFDIAVYLGLFATLRLNNYAYLATFQFAYSTVQLLCFASGILMLVPAAQSRHRVWFGMLLVWLIIASYGPWALQTYRDVLTITYQSGSYPTSAEETAAFIFPFATYIAPEVPALIALLYTLFTQSRRATIPQSDDALQVEITSLRTPENAQ
ncbi:MAG TPA: hypothetical protein VF510_12740 [Ktedonobacterales bacterium]